MNQGSCVVVTSFWNVSAVRDTEVPLAFGGGPGFTACFVLPLFAVSKDSIAVLVKDASAATLSLCFSPAAMPAAASLSLANGVSGEAVLSTLLAPASGTLSPSLGLEPGLISSNFSST